MDDPLFLLNFPHFAESLLKAYQDLALCKSLDTETRVGPVAPYTSRPRDSEGICEELQRNSGKPLNLPGSQ